MIPNKFLCYQTEAGFLSDLGKGLIQESSVVMVLEGPFFYTHGVRFNCIITPEYLESLELLISKSIAGLSDRLDENERTTAHAFNQLVAETSKGVSKEDIGLGQVDNTSDLNKPVSTATLAELNKKVDKENGKQLSTNDFTTALKDKLESLSNYNDTEVKASIQALETKFSTLLEGNPTKAIESFNEIVKFLEGIEDTESLDSIVKSIEKQILDAKTETEEALEEINSKIGQPLTFKVGSAVLSYAGDNPKTITLEGSEFISLEMNDEGEITISVTSSIDKLSYWIARSVSDVREDLDNSNKVIAAAIADLRRQIQDLRND